MGTPPLTVNTSGQIIAFHVPEDIYLRDYAEDFCEWVDGTVIKMSPIHDRHDAIARYLAILLETYFAFRPVGVIRQEPFVMRLQFEQQDGAIRLRYREPDIQVILVSNQQALTETFMDGPADIVVEIISPESTARDYGEKLHEYERSGVPEYWIIDPLRKECRFYRLSDRQAYILQETEHIYTTPNLPGLQLHLAIFWQDQLPKPPAIVKTVQAMLNDDA